MKKLIAFMLAALMVASLFSGCKEKETSESTTAPTEVIKDFAQVDWD